MADSYYLVIRGKKYDRRMVELADGLTAGRGDGRISINDAKNLLRIVKDSNTYSQVEKQTMEYIRRRYKFTKEGDELFRTEIRKWAASKRGTKSVKATPSKSKGRVKQNAAIVAPTAVAAAASPMENPGAALRHDEPRGSALKEILFALFLLVAIAALFYFIVYKSGCVKPAAPQAPATAEIAKPPEPVAPAAATAQPAMAEPAKPVATVAPVSTDLTAFIEKSQISFIAEKTELTPAGTKALDELAQKIKSEKIKIQITGHTCSLGPKSLNQEISVNRAKIVKEALVARGVDAASLEVRGVAETEPVGDNKTVAGRVANRRVNFKVIK